MIRTGPSSVLLPAIALACAFTLSCKQDPSPPVPIVGMVATVNDTPITETDVLLNTQNVPRGHQAAGPSADTREVLEDIIQQELAYQRALELGLDADPDYQDELQRMEAQVTAIKRKRLSEVFFQREMTQKTQVSDAEARQYFADNAERLRTEINVWQILRRDQGSIEKIRADLAQGLSFEEVVNRQFPDLPDLDRKPWDLGYLRWNQVPEAWQKVVYDLQIGESSDIIRGPNNRFWIVKLIDKRENPDITFEQIQSTITDLLKNEKARRLREDTLQDLRSNARIVYSK